MFGFDLSLWMIRDMIRILNEQDDFISSNQLLDLLGYSNLGQIKKLCKDLQKYIQESYSEDEFELIINTRNGIRFVTSSSRNAQSLIDFIFSKDLAFEIYQSVLFERTVSTEDFCQRSFISASTLQRKIKKINADINRYGLHLSYSRQKFSIQGKEATVRSAAFIFLYIKHRQISNIFWIENKQHYLELSKKIADFLALPFRTTQFENFSLFLFIFETAIQQGHRFVFEQEAFPYQEDLQFPDKPSFISWPEEEWQALLLMTYNSNLVNYTIPIDTSAFHSEKLDALVTAWVHCFEQYFAPLDQNQREFLYQNLIKRYFSDYFLAIDETLLKAFPAVDFRLIEKNKPFYLQLFTNFWDDLSKRQPTWTTPHLKTQSFLLCEYFFPIMNALPEVKLYVFTDLTILSLHRIQNNLEIYFSNKYKFTFVSTWEAADVIIGTINFREQTLSEKQQFIMIRLQLTSRDLLHIDEAVQRFLVR